MGRLIVVFFFCNLPHHTVKYVGVYLVNLPIFKLAFDCPLQTRKPTGIGVGLFLCGLVFLGLRHGCCCVKMLCRTCEIAITYVYYGCVWRKFGRNPKKEPSLVPHRYQRGRGLGPQVGGGTVKVGLDSTTATRLHQHVGLWTPYVGTRVAALTSPM